VETVGFCQVMWLDVLESDKDRIIVVNTPRQYVLPHVQYGTACLLVRYAGGCVSCSVEWRWLLALRSVFVTFLVNCLNHMVQEGSLCVRNLNTASEDRLSGNHSKA
jgi:hypothetical protein